MFKTDLVQVSFLDEQRGVWDFAGKLCKGMKFLYEVDDGNYRCAIAGNSLCRSPTIGPKTTT